MTPAPRAESRIFPALAVLALPIILALLPSRYQLMPPGLPFVGAGALAVPMLLAGFSLNKEFAWRAERYVGAIVLPPIFADYLALPFNASAAFSPTDVLPLTPRAKMLMVLQSAISLVTVIAVGARAINILGS